jgi:hypothetical protein
VDVAYLESIYASYLRNQLRFCSLVVSSLHKLRRLTPLVYVVKNMDN